MKKIVLISVILFVQISQSQTYILDTTFGNNGTVFTTLVNEPNSIVLENNFYYITSYRSMTRLNYNGTIDPTFGTNGIYTLPSPINGFERYITKSKIIGNAIYMAGYSQTSNNSNILLWKLSIDGVLDTSFGVNGYCTIDLAGEETISDFCLDQNNTIFCIGRRQKAISNGYTRSLLVSKVLPNGTIDTSFGTNGTIQYLTSDTIYVIGASIYYHNGALLLVGAQNYKLLLAKADNNGVLDTTFDANGFKSIAVSHTLSEAFIKYSQLIGDTLYAYYNSYLIKYNLITNVKEADFNVGSNAWIDVDGSVYSHVFTSCSSPDISYCDSDFSLKKRLLSDGTIDTSFHINGGFIYDPSPNLFFSFDRSTMSRKDSNGNILIAGFSYRGPLPVAQLGITLVRIMEGALGTYQTMENSNMSFYPNPFSDYINFDLNVPIVNVSLFDINGRKLSNPSYDLNSNKLHVDMPTQLQKGIYIIEISTTDNKKIVQKIIKK